MTTLSPNQRDNTSIHWPSFLQLILSLLAAFILIGASIILIFSAVIQNSTNAAGASDPTGAYMMAASLAFGGVLVLPSAWYAWQHIAYPEKVSIPHPRSSGYGLILTIVVFILVGGALLLGNWSSQNGRLTWLLLPLLNIIATGLPALWIIYIGTRGLLHGTPRRQWGVFASGLVLGPLIILVLELFLLALVAILALLWMMLNPAYANQLYGMAIRLESAGQDLNAVLKILLPLLVNPGILFLGFAFISVLVPLLEEALKPIGVWFLSGQKITPAQGFAYGVLSGAGFGLFENLGNTSGGSSEWALIASMRISTLLLHCFTAGLVGWALASAWSERRYLRLAITYAIAVTLHGLWNSLAVFSVLPTLQSFANLNLPPALQQIGSVASSGIIALGALVLVLYISSNSLLLRNVSTTSMTIPGDGPSVRQVQADLLTADEPRKPSDNPGGLPTPDSNPSIRGEEQNGQQSSYNSTKI